MVTIFSRFREIMAKNISYCSYQKVHQVQNPRKYNIIKNMQQQQAEEESSLTSFE